MGRFRASTLPTLIALLSLASSCEMGSKSITFTTSPSTSNSSGSPSSPSPPSNCSGGPYNILVSWTANREKAVNTTGGGYKVYYSTSTPVNTSSASNVDVPYVSGSSTPSSRLITGLTCGTWHFRVVAYSALHPSGSLVASRSADSSEVTVTVP
ncbi:MAG: hypothetical protein ACJ763_18970 [Bdellovibrionia bacterium]